jgi:hypothetical protein
MAADMKHIHHVGHVVKDIGAALELYRRLGFVCHPPAYPMMAEKEDEEPKPFGAANTHAYFLRNFIEIVTVVEDGKPIPDDAHLIPLQAPPAVLSRILEKIKRTVATISRCLSRSEGTHILCFCTSDAEATAARFDKAGVGHSGVNNLQRPVETTTGMQMIPLRYLEIEGRMYRKAGWLSLKIRPLTFWRRKLIWIIRMDRQSLSK